MTQKNDWKASLDDYGKGILRNAVRLRAKAGRPFQSDEEILDFCFHLFNMREFLLDNRDPALQREGAEINRDLTRQLHVSLGQSKELYIPSVCRKHRLNRMEREVLLLLTCYSLGSYRKRNLEGPSESRWKLADVNRLVGSKSATSLSVFRCLAPRCRLVRTGLVLVSEYVAPVNRDVGVTAEFLEPLLNCAGQVANVWDVKKYEEFLDRCHAFGKILVERSEIHGPTFWATGYGPDLAKCNRQIARQYNLFRNTVAPHPSWPLREIRELQDDSSIQMVIVLLAKELGLRTRHDSVFTGIGLARAASEEDTEVRHNLALLQRDAPLRQKGYVRVCGGIGDSPITEDQAALETCEFELTVEFLDRIKVRKLRKASSRARTPMVRLDQLVLAPRILNALKMACTQVKHGVVMFGKWGLESIVPYGKTVSMLFSGPPGVGKTAAAEAIAHELNKKILVVSYAEIQNCFVGETEKNIVRIFREAAEQEAVLFWDEADAMFYGREQGMRSWEIRDVNVLLQELERFSGLCILATNRTTSLDKALERRVAIKVEFEAPGLDARRKIWEKMIPGKMPLARDVDFEELAEANLTGGEIKNVVLNAARNALSRDPNGRVAMEDFRLAVEMERDGRWNKEKRGQIGFAR
jgi:hypothetical protein